MNYAESEKILDSLRRQNEMMFLMAISHLMDVGIRHLTEENIARTCEQIMQEDDTHSFMTNAFKCDLIRLAGELAKIDHIHLLVYISRHLNYDVGDRGIHLSRAIEIILYLLGQIECDHGRRFVKSILNAAGLWSMELRFIGREDLIDEDEEEE